MHLTAWPHHTERHAVIKHIARHHTLSRPALPSQASAQMHARNWGAVTRASSMLRTSTAISARSNEHVVCGLHTHQFGAAKKYVAHRQWCVQSIRSVSRALPQPKRTVHMQQWCGLVSCGYMYHFKRSSSLILLNTCTTYVGGHVQQWCAEAHELYTNHLHNHQPVS